MRKIAIFSLLTLVMMLVISCSSKSYMDCIPAETSAVVSLDAAKITSAIGRQDIPLLSQLIGVGNAEDLGIDPSEKYYFFETKDGILGFCAAVSSEKGLKKTVNEKLIPKRLCSKLSEKDGVSFTVFKDSWIVGFTNEALMILGPVMQQSQSQLKRRMIKWLNMDGRKSFTDSQMFEYLDEMSSPLALVAQSHVLPEMFSSLVTLGLPRNVDPSQVIVSAELTPSDGDILKVYVSTFSFNEGVEKQIGDAKKEFSNVTGNLLSKVSLLDMSVMVNVKGENLLTMLRDRKEFQSALAGINTAIDIDNIIRTFDGEVVMTTNNTDTSKELSILAETSSSNWMKDVDYWKRSCPAGSSLINTKERWFDYKFNNNNDGRHFYFGMIDDRHFFGTTIKGSETGDNILQNNLKNIVAEKRMVVVLKKSSLFANLDLSMKAIAENAFSSLFGSSKIIVVTVN